MATTKDLIDAVVADDLTVADDTAKLAADTATDQTAHGDLGADLAANGPAAVIVTGPDAGSAVVVYRPDGSGGFTVDPPVRIA